MTKLVEGLLVDSPKLQKPFRAIVAGGSGSGKSCFVQKLIEQNHFSSDFDLIKYVYPDYLDESPMDMNTDQIIEYTPGLPTCHSLASIDKNTLVILDDLMLEVANCADIARFFSVIARKKNISVIMIVQNIFMQGKHFRNIRLNATHIILFKFYAGLDTNYRIIRDLGLTESVTKGLMDKVYSKPFSYILLDLHPSRHSSFSSVRTNIFDNFSSILYSEMEYVAIPKADFLKYFKIIETKKGKVKALQNEFAVKKVSAKRKSDKSDRKERKRRRRNSGEKDQHKSDRKREHSSAEPETSNSESEPEFVETTDSGSD